MQRLFAFRLLGASKVRIPLSGGRTRKEVRDLAPTPLCPAEGVVDLGFLGWYGDRYDLAPLGYPIVLEAHFLAVSPTRARAVPLSRAPGGRRAAR